MSKMKPEVAQRRIESFAKRFGQAHLYFAYHAAFPLALTPDLLYGLWINFQQDIHGKVLGIPWIAVADLLLSALCDEVGHELYEMDLAVRNELLRQVQSDERFGKQRISQLSNFLLEYIQKQLLSDDTDIQDFAKAQQWIALAYTQPNQAARELALAFSKLDERDKPELVRMASLMETFAEPLSEFPLLLIYARGMGKFARGDLEAAKAEIKEILKGRNNIQVADIDLPIPRQIKPHQSKFSRLKISRRQFLKWAGFGGVALVTAVVTRELSKKHQVNDTMMQYFHWYIPNDGMLWDKVNSRAKELADAGFTAMWLPPAYKGMDGTYDVGYAVYDMYDLGEFEQKGSIRTKYGTRQEYLDAVKSLQSTGIKVYGDTVLNHRIGGDDAEIAKATPFSRNNRLNPKGEMRDIKCYTHYKFPGRKGKYSQFEWHWWHFDAVDYDEYSQDSSTIYLLEGKSFDDYTALENGNFDYLMGCDLDFQNQEVRDEVTRWGKWYLDTTGVDGFRLDAIKHISAWFFPQWLDELEKYIGKNLFAVGEYWSKDINILLLYLNNFGSRISVFDVPLHYNFHEASKSGSNYDMQRILDGSMMQERPKNAITFVENHDSQPLQALESPVESWFKPLAYAIILLRLEGSPCVFYADYYGAEYEDYGQDGNRQKIVIPALRSLIDKFLYVRQNFAYGLQHNYLDHQNIIGWTRLGNWQHLKAMAVIMSNSAGGTKWMEVGKPDTKFYDLTENINEPLYTDGRGWAEFRCNPRSVSVWIQD